MQREGFLNYETNLIKTEIPHTYLDIATGELHLKNLTAFSQKDLNINPFIETGLKWVKTFSGTEGVIDTNKKSLRGTLVTPDTVYPSFDDNKEIKYKTYNKEDILNDGPINILFSEMLMKKGEREEDDFFPVLEYLDQKYITWNMFGFFYVDDHKREYEFYTVAGVQSIHAFEGDQLFCQIEDKVKGVHKKTPGWMAEENALDSVIKDVLLSNASLLLDKISFVDASDAVLKKIVQLSFPMYLSRKNEPKSSHIAEVLDISKDTLYKLIKKATSNNRKSISKLNDYRELFLFKYLYKKAFVHTAFKKLNKNTTSPLFRKSIETLIPDITTDEIFVHSFLSDAILEKEKQTAVRTMFAFAGDAPGFDGYFLVDTRPSLDKRIFRTGNECGIEFLSVCSASDIDEKFEKLSDIIGKKTIYVELDTGDLDQEDISELTFYLLKKRFELWRDNQNQ